MRKTLPMALTVLAGLWYMLCSYSAKIDALGLQAKTDYWISVTFAVACLIGAINMFRVHGKNIMRRKEGWYNSLVLLVVLTAYTIYGLATSVENATWVWFWDNVWTPCDSTMFSLLCFYIASSAYRAFRVRTREATIMLAAAFVVMLGNVPFGKLIWSEIPNLKNWLMAVPNSAGMRAILLGSYVGAFAVAMRVLLGVERAHLGGTGQ